MNTDACCDSAPRRLFSRENEKYLKMGCSLLPKHAVLVTFRMNADAPNASSEWFSTIYGDLETSGPGQLPNGRSEWTFRISADAPNACSEWTLLIPFVRSVFWRVFWCFYIFANARGSMRIFECLTGR